MFLSRLLVLFSILLLIGGVSAGDGITAAEAAIREAPGRRIESLVMGRLLDADDDAAFVAISDEEPLPKRQVIVMARDAAGDYRVVDRSALVPFPERDEMWLEIRRGSLFVHEPRTGPRVSRVHVHQFRREAGTFRLIGRETQSFFHGEVPEPGELAASEFRISTNFLTGKVITTRKSGVVEQRLDLPHVTLATWHRHDPDGLPVSESTRPDGAPGGSS